MIFLDYFLLDCFVWDCFVYEPFFHIKNLSHSVIYLHLGFAPTNKNGEELCIRSAFNFNFCAKSGTTNNHRTGSRIKPVRNFDF